MTPAERLAAALEAAIPSWAPKQAGQSPSRFSKAVAAKALAADPTLAQAIAIGEAIMDEHNPALAEALVVAMSFSTLDKTDRPDLWRAGAKGLHDALLRIVK